MIRTEKCEMADSNGNIMEVGFRLPVSYTWKKCNDLISQTIIYEKGKIDSIKGYPKHLRYVDTRSELSINPESRRYIEKFGLYEYFNIAESKHEILVGAVVDGIVYGSVTLNVKNQNIQIPSKFRLHQNYPNPFNPITNIQFDLPRDVYVTLKVYDVLGKEVEILVNGFYKAGSYITSFYGSKLSNGVYFYRIQAGNFVSVKRMLLIK